MLADPTARQRADRSYRLAYRAGVVVLASGLVLSSCGQQQPAEAPGSTTSSPITSNTTSSAASQPVEADVPTVTIGREGSCPNNFPYVAALTSFPDWTATIGKMVSPTEPRPPKLVWLNEQQPMLYSEFDAVIESELYGPHIASHVAVSLPGGKADGYVTEIGRTTQSAWAEDGSFIALIRPDSQAPTGMVMDSLPIVDDRVVFPGVGCFTPSGLSDVDKRSVSVLVFVNGTVVESSGVYATASLDEIVRSMRS